VRLQVRLIPIEQLSGVTGIAALYVTSGLTGSMEAVWTAARRLHIPTISADLACVQAGNCVVGFSTQPTVQILIDNAAAERAGVRFVQAFRMLVREK
jgi:ribosomal protein S12 methylthiotransferase accessory factor YcaO